MINEERENTESNEQEKKRDKTEIQITVSTKAEMKVAALVEQVNDGFEHGRVSRKDLASYLLLKSAEEFDHEDIARVRSQVLTDVILLEHALKQARESGVIPDDLRDFLWKSINLTPSPKKTRKTGHGKGSNVNNEKSEAA